jgi:hypothetical protein
MKNRVKGMAVRDGLLVPASLCLLTTAMIAPDSRAVRTLRGVSGIEQELQQAETRGYYEDLLDASPRMPAARLAARDEDGRRPPPPGWVPFGAAGIVDERPIYLRWRLKPNLDLVWNGARFHTNSRGYRTPEVPLEKPAGVYRIAVFGSSNTMGHGVDDDASYPRLLERWLNERLGPSHRVEVLNFAVSGDSPSRRLARLREEGNRFHADWILCDATPLDASLEEDHLRWVTQHAPEVPIPFDFVAEALRQCGASPGDSPAEFAGKLRAQFRPLLAGAYAGWRQESGRLGVPLSVVMIPRADRKVENPYIIEVMRETARREGLPVIDLLDAFRDLSTAEFRVSPWDMHPSERGHRAIFDRFRDALEQQGGLPHLSFAQDAR